MAPEKLASAIALDPESLKLQIDAAIASGGLRVEPEWRAGIEAHFEAIARAAARANPDSARAVSAGAATSPVMDRVAPVVSWGLLVLPGWG